VHNAVAVFAVPPDGAHEYVNPPRRRMHLPQPFHHNFREQVTALELIAKLIADGCCIVTELTI
jgi:hypothetical protein